MVMARPPASKSQKLRTGNYYLIWSGLMLSFSYSHISAGKYSLAGHIVEDSGTYTIIFCVHATCLQECSYFSHEFQAGACSCSHVLT